MVVVVWCGGGCGVVWCGGGCGVVWWWPVVAMTH